LEVGSCQQSTDDGPQASAIPNAGDVISTTQEEKSHPWVNGTAKAIPSHPTSRYRDSQLQVKKCVKWISTNSSAVEGLSVYVTARSLLGRRGGLINRRRHCEEERRGSPLLCSTSFNEIAFPKFFGTGRQDPLLSSRDFSRNDEIVTPGS